MFVKLHLLCMPLALSAMVAAHSQMPAAPQPGTSSAASAAPKQSSGAVAFSAPAYTPKPAGTATASGAPQNAGSVSNASAPLTLQDALQRAQANEPAFAAASAQRRVAALQRADARAGLLPSAILHNQYLFTESNKTIAATTQGGLPLSLPVFIANNAVHEYISQASVNETVSLAGIAAVKLADANAAVAAAEYEVARRGLVQTVVSLFYGTSAADQKVAVAERALAEANHFVEITKDREQAREAAHADVLKAQLGQQQRERELDEARLLASKTRLELGVLLFPNPATDYTLAKSEAPPVLPDRAGMEALARANNPEIRSAAASLQATQAETLTAQAALLPDLALNFTYGIDAPQFARRGTEGARNLGYSASATVDLPLWDWLTSERKIKEAHILAQSAKTTLSAAQRRALANLAEIYDEASVANKELASLDQSAADARESLRLTNLRYVNGEATVLEVVDAQNTLLLAENAQADGYVRYRVAIAELETLTGRL